MATLRVFAPMSTVRLTISWNRGTMGVMDGALTSFLLSVAGSLIVALLISAFVALYKRRGEPLVESFFAEYFEKSSKPLQDDLAALTEKVDSQSMTIRGLQQDISELHNKSGQQTEAMGGLQQGVSELRASLGQQTQTVGGLQTGVLALGANVEEQIESFQATVRDVKSQVAGMDEKVDDLISLELQVGDARQHFQEKYRKPRGETGDEV